MRKIIASLHYWNSGISPTGVLFTSRVRVRVGVRVSTSSSPYIGF